MIDFVQHRHDINRTNLQSSPWSWGRVSDSTVLSVCPLCRYHRLVPPFKQSTIGSRVLPVAALYKVWNALPEKHHLLEKCHETLFDDKKNSQIFSMQVSEKMFQLFTRLLTRVTVFKEMYCCRPQKRWV